MMLRRRLESNDNVLDTTPVIIQSGVAYPSGNPDTKPLLQDNSLGITGIYQLDEVPQAMQQCTLKYVGSYNIIYKDNNEYLDFYGGSGTNETTKNMFSTAARAVAFTIMLQYINDCYAFNTDTGQIFFAGRNTIYYGHQNISEISQGG